MPCLLDTLFTFTRRGGIQRLMACPSPMTPSTRKGARVEVQEVRETATKGVRIKLEPRRCQSASLHPGGQGIANVGVNRELPLPDSQW